MTPNGEDVVRYLCGHLVKGTTPAEGSFSAVINKLEPTDRAKVMTLVGHMDAVDKGFHAPFQKPLSAPDVAALYGQERTHNMTGPRQLHQKLTDEYLTAGLQARMGVDALAPTPEPNLRDHIAAAVAVQPESKT